MPSRSAGQGPWALEVTPLPGATHELAVVAEGAPVSHGEVLELLAGEQRFRGFFDRALSEVVARSGSAAVFWETPPVTRATLERAFRCVLVDAPGLGRMAPEPFVFEAELAQAGPEGVASFPNLGGDAMLVVPAGRAGVADRAYAHLAAFLREAPPDQRDALWAAVGEAAAARVGRRPLWVSTSGAGVAWLHVRLDDAPKYYVHAPYRVA